MDCAQRNQCFAGTAFRDHHACPRLMPAFDEPHDGDGLRRKGLSQQPLDPRRNWIIELVKCRILLKNALTQRTGVSTHICEDVSYVVVAHGSTFPRVVAWID